MDKQEQASENSPIVKYDRGLKKYYNSIFEMSKVEIDLFITVLSIICKEKKQKLEISRNDIINLSQYTSENRGENYTVKKMVEHLDHMSDKIGGMYYLIHDENSSMDIKMYLFDTFGINKSTGDLKISLAPTFSSYFFNIPDNTAFTRYYLIKMLNLKSKYAKILYQIFLDNHDGFTISMEDFDILFGAETANARYTIMNRLKSYIKQVDATGDFIGPISYSYNKDPYNQRKNKSITFRYKEKPRRVRESNKPNKKDSFNLQTIDNQIPVSATPEKMGCPYCGDNIIELKNKQNGQKFFCHEHWQEHKNCPLKNQPTREDMLDAIAEATMKIEDIKKAEEQKNYRAKALAELQEEYPNGINSDIDVRNQTSDDIERALNGGFCEKDIMKKIDEIKNRESDKSDDDSPFPDFKPVE